MDRLNTQHSQQAPGHMRVNQSQPNLASYGQQVMTPQHNNMGSMDIQQEQSMMMSRNNPRYNDVNMVSQINPADPISQPSNDPYANFLAGQTKQGLITKGNAFASEQEQIDKMKKRQAAIQLQQEQMHQVEERKRKMELEKLEEKRKDELMDIKMQKERQQMESEIIKDYETQIRKQNRNLNESLDPKIEKEIRDKRQKEFYDDLEKSRMSNKNFNVQPVMNDDIEQSKYDYNRDQEELERQRKALLIQQRVIKELPIEITGQVQNTINQELLKLKNEISYHQNHLGEQMLNLRGAIISTNNEKHQISDEIEALKKDLKKTQYLDEIRQREIYNAFVLQHKPNYYISNTERLMPPELKQFVPPQRPRPYYNRNDPYLDGFHMKHNHNPLDNITTHVDFEVKNKDIFGEKNIDEVYYAKERKNPIHEEHYKHYYQNGNFERKGINVQNTQKAHIPDDHCNRQKLYVPRDEDIDVHHLLVKNQNRMDALDEVFETDKKDRGIDELDTALFNNLLKRDNEMEHKFANRQPVSLHYQYKDFDKGANYTKGHQGDLDDYDNIRSKQYKQY